MGADAYVPPAQLQALQFLEMTITSVTHDYWNYVLWAERKTTTF